jgi:hypothetical protein
MRHWSLTRILYWPIRSPFKVQADCPAEPVNHQVKPPHESAEALSVSNGNIRRKSLNRQALKSRSGFFIGKGFNHARTVTTDDTTVKQVIPLREKASPN